MAWRNSFRSSVESACAWPKAGVKRRCWKPTPCEALNSSVAISSMGRVEAMA